VSSPILNVWKLTDDFGARDMTLAGANGALRPLFCLIRPAGYVMARWQPGDVERVAEFLTSWFPIQGKATHQVAHGPATKGFCISSIGVCWEDSRF